MHGERGVQVAVHFVRSEQPIYVDHRDRRPAEHQQRWVPQQLLQRDPHLILHDSHGLQLQRCARDETEVNQQGGPQPEVEGKELPHNQSPPR